MGSSLAPSGRELAAVTTEYRAAGVEAVSGCPPTAPHFDPYSPSAYRQVRSRWYPLLESRSSGRSAVW